MQHLLGLGIRILGGNFMDPADHYVAVLCMLERNAHQEESQEEGKTQQSHQRAHAGTLSTADSNRAAAPVAGDGPDQVSGQKYKESQGMQDHRQNVGKNGQRSGGTKEVFPIDSHQGRKVSRQRRIRQRD